MGHAPLAALIRPRDDQCQHSNACLLPTAKYGCSLLRLLSSDRPYLYQLSKTYALHNEERGNAAGTAWEIIAGLGPIAVRLAHGLKSELMHLTACACELP